MKTLFTFLAVTILATTLQAKIVYLNNNLEVPNISENVFINWSDAYAAVSAGDTIYVFGSNSNYGAISFDKPITLIGPGYFLAQNSNTQVNKLAASFGDIRFESGGTGTELIGIACSGSYLYELIISVSDISLTSCYFENDISISGSANINDITIKQCYFNSYISYSYLYDGVFNDFTFINNIVKGSYSVPNGSAGIIAYNVFVHSTFYSGASSSFEIANNIYLNSNENKFTIRPLPDASVHHNISLTGAFGNENDNFSAPQSTLFISDENASTDGQYMLSENSPAKGAGSNGTDIGPFGGPDPYRLSGLPNLPNIYELSSGGFVSGDELPVTIKIKQ